MSMIHSLVDYLIVHIKVIVNSLGLLFGIIGSFLIWRFGLPASIDRLGEEHLVSGSIDETEVRKGKLFDFRSRIGFMFLLISFFLQLVSNFL